MRNLLPPGSGYLDRGDASSARLSKSSAAFTLVELLVTIAIVTVLLSLLTPALQNARQLAHAAACASNLRQSSLAMLHYAADYDDVLTPFQDFGGNGYDFWYKMLRYFKYGQGTYMCPSGSNVSWMDPNNGKSPVMPWSVSYEPVNISGSPGQQQPELGWFMEDRTGMPLGYAAVAPDRTNYGAASTYGIGTWATTAGTLHWLEALPMMDMYPYASPSDPALAALRKPTISRAFKPAETAVLFDGMFLFRFDKNFWTFIHLRHHGGRASSFAFMDGHAETRPWNRMPPGERFAGSGRHDPLVDAITAVGPYGGTTQLRNLLNTAPDGVALTSPRANHYMRFIVPKVVLGTTTPLGD